MLDVDKEVLVNVVKFLAVCSEEKRDKLLSAMLSRVEVKQDNIALDRLLSKSKVDVRKLIRFF
jgi:hypothetical protein